MADHYGFKLKHNLFIKLKRHRLLSDQTVLMNSQNDSENTECDEIRYENAMRQWHELKLKHQSSDQSYRQHCGLNEWECNDTVKRWGLRFRDWKRMNREEYRSEIQRQLNGKRCGITSEINKFETTPKRSGFSKNVQETRSETDSVPDFETYTVPDSETDDLRNVLDSERQKLKEEAQRLKEWQEQLREQEMRMQHHEGRHDQEYIVSESSDNEDFESNEAEKRLNEEAHRLQQWQNTLDDQQTKLQYDQETLRHDAEQLVNDKDVFAQNQARVLGMHQQALEALNGERKQIEKQRNDLNGERETLRADMERFESEKQEL